MSAIAGLIPLKGQQAVSSAPVQNMAAALRHRGPDGEALWQRDGVALACRILGAPSADDERSTCVVFDGHLVDAACHWKNLEKRGPIGNRSDANLVARLWDEHQEGMFDCLRGQFAFALFDSRQRRLILARDRFGICPLFFTRQGDWLLFASEIKGLLASGMAPARVDRRGINHLFTFFALPGPVTCFADISSLLPGHYLDIRLDQESASISERVYWQADFPEQGSEERGEPGRLVNAFEGVLLAAVERQLQGDLPSACYLSGGIDSGIVAALAGRVRGQPVPTYTIRIAEAGLDESGDVALIARQLGSSPVTVSCGVDEIFATLPRLVHASESPIIDTACAALLLLAEKTRADGCASALTGEGADEWFGSYPWFKFHKLLSKLDVIPGVRLSLAVRQLFLRVTKSPRFAKEMVQQTRASVGGHSPWLDAYGLMSMSKLRFYSESMRQVMLDNLPYADLGLDLERMRRWHPLHRDLYIGTRIHLPGLLLAAKNDRPAMHASVQPRFPFLDEEVFSFLARLHPDWKLRGFKDKYLLRLVAERWLPKSLVWRKKALFRAPTQLFSGTNWPRFAEQLLSEESLRRADYFEPAAVAHWREAFKNLRDGSTTRTSVEMGLAGVLTTQLWHHLFIEPTLCELPAPGK